MDLNKKASDAYKKMQQDKSADAGKADHAKPKSRASQSAKAPIVPGSETAPPQPKPKQSRTPRHKDWANNQSGQKEPARRHSKPSRTILKQPTLPALDDEDAFALLKTGTANGAVKAAKLLLLLGTEEASKVLSHLAPHEIEEIMKHLITINTIPASEADMLSTELSARPQSGQSISGKDYARKIITTAFGREKAARFLQKIGTTTQKPFLFLEDFSPQQILLLLSGESPMTLAVIISQLKPIIASKIIMKLDAATRVETIKRMATMGTISAEVMVSVETALLEKSHKLAKTREDEVDGVTKLANILKHYDAGKEAKVIESIESIDPALGKSIKDRLFTFDDILRIPDRQIQTMLYDIDDRTLALALKGRSAAFKAKILRNLSAGRQQIIEEEYRGLGSVRSDIANAAATELLAMFKVARNSGRIILVDDDEIID